MYPSILIIASSRTLRSAFVSLRSRWWRWEDPPLSLLPFGILLPHSSFTLWLIEPTLKLIFEIVLEPFVACTGRYADLLRCICLDFLGGRCRGVGNLGQTGCFPGFGLSFCFAGRWRCGLVAAKFAEIELLDGVLTEDGRR